VKTSFDLVLKSRERDLLEKGVAVAALWISLGALGSRSTRAAGCMRLDTEYAGDPSSLWEKVSTKLPLENGKNPPFELYRSNSAMEDGLEAAKWLAKKWRELRSHRTSNGIGKKDHDEASDLLLKAKKSKGIKVRRVVLGMPYTQSSQRRGSPFRNKKLQWEPAKGEHFFESRLASPVHLRPIYKNGNVYPALLIFTNRLSDCPNYVYANKAGKIKIKVDKKAAIDKVRSICAIREI
jgi:CRISPR/Cas system CMR-associated protein Cmr1 (group 7 of RAMP superfamily)